MVDFVDFWWLFLLPEGRNYKLEIKIQEAFTGTVIRIPGYGLQKGEKRFARKNQHNLPVQLRNSQR